MWLCKLIINIWGQKNAAYFDCNEGNSGRKVREINGFRASLEALHDIIARHVPSVNTNFGWSAMLLFAPPWQKISNNFRAYWKSDACVAQLHHSSAHFHFDRRESSLIRVKKKGRKRHKYFISFPFRRLSINIYFVAVVASDTNRNGRENANSELRSFKEIAIFAGQLSVVVVYWNSRKKTKRTYRERSHIFLSVDGGGGDVARNRKTPNRMPFVNSIFVWFVGFFFFFFFSFSFLDWLTDSVRSSRCEREKVDGRKDGKYRVLFLRFGAVICLVAC